jgi:hypothetical protein
VLVGSRACLHRAVNHTRVGCLHATEPTGQRRSGPLRGTTTIVPSGSRCTLTLTP